MTNLGPNMQQTKDELTKLEQQKWIDQYTRVVFVEFNTWNPNTNLFSLVTLSFEFSMTGGVEIWKDFESVYLYRYTGGIGLVNLIVEIISLIVGVVSLVKEVKNMIKLKWEYFLELWNVVTFAAICLYFSSVAMYVWRSVLIVDTMNDVMNNRGKFSTIEAIKFSFSSIFV